MVQPNILWICTDQQRFDTLNCSQNSFVHTPNIDRLAAEGVQFTHAFSQSPVCAPSRASFLSGRYPRTTRCRQNGQAIPDTEILLPRILRDAGYRTGLSGKLHISPCHPKVCNNYEPRIDDGYQEFHWSHHPGADWPANEYVHWLREKGVAHETKAFEGSKHVRIGMPAELHQTTWCTQKAINFIEACTAAKKQHPWMFSVNLFDPHHAFDPPAEYLERYASRLDDIPLPSYVPGELENKPVWQRIDHRNAYGGVGGYPYDEMTDTDHRWIRAAYWAMCDLIDEQVGRLMETLERTGQLENTIVIYTSDHGEMLGDHGIYLKGPYFYDCAVRVPLIIRWPEHIAGNQRSSALVELVDLAPTLLEAAGLPSEPGIQGKSLWPLLSGQADLQKHRDDVYCEFYAANFTYKPIAYTTMLRTDRYKLTVAHDLRMGELYDLAADPGEHHNLWYESSYQEVKCELLVRLTDRMAFTADPLPLRQAPW